MELYFATAYRAVISSEVYNENSTAQINNIKDQLNIFHKNNSEQYDGTEPL